MNEITFRLILCDLRGAGNVGSILRTADACSVELVYVCGYTPYPPVPRDNRPPHIVASNLKQIAKTALGAHLTVPIQHILDPVDAIAEAERDGFQVIVIEQAENSLNLFSFKPTNRKLAIVLGNEVTGVDLSNISATTLLEIPMNGQKESLNVAVAAAVVLYQLKFGHTG